MLAGLLYIVFLCSNAPDTISHTFIFEENQLTFSAKHG